MGDPTLHARSEANPDLPARPLTVRPFRGLMLGPARIGDPGSARVFGRPYRQVLERLTLWQEQGQATHDDAPALYLHEYSAEHMSVRGLVGTIELTERVAPGEEPGVYIHEGIDTTHSERLGQRMLDLGMNPAPILMSYTGTPTTRALIEAKARTAPEHDFTDRSRQHHRIWSFRGDEVTPLVAELATRSAMIADGHHRFAAYLQLQREHPGTPWDRGLAMLVDQDDTPLFLGAIHRVLRGLTLEQFEQACSRGGVSCEWLPRDAAVAALGPRKPVVTDGTAWLLVRLPPSSNNPSVAFLHTEILPKLDQAPSQVSYHHSVEDALTSITHGEDLAVLLPAPSYSIISEHVIHEGLLLPEKATSFQPKPSVGVVMRMLGDE